jgi:hypothetical protein
MPTNNTSATSGPPAGESSSSTSSGPTAAVSLGSQIVPTSPNVAETTSTTTSARISQQHSLLVTTSNSSSEECNEVFDRRIKPTVTTVHHHQSFVGISTATSQPSLAHAANQPDLRSAEMQTEPLVAKTSNNPSDDQSCANKLPVTDAAYNIISQQIMGEDPQPSLIIQMKDNSDHVAVLCEEVESSNPQLSLQVIFKFSIRFILN